jgi:hypothetical protein
MAYSLNFPNVERFRTPAGVYNFPDTPSLINITLTSPDTYMAEFFIPDVSSFKFIGSPAKFFSFPNLLQQPSPTSDLGSIMFRIENHKLDTEFVSDFQFLEYSVYAGLSDEARLGFHSISPLFLTKTGNQSTYKNYLEGLPDFPTSKLPISMYKGHPNAE